MAGGTLLAKYIIKIKQKYKSTDLKERLEHIVTKLKNEFSMGTSISIYEFPNDVEEMIAENKAYLSDIISFTSIDDRTYFLTMGVPIENIDFERGGMNNVLCLLIDIPFSLSFLREIEAINLFDIEFPPGFFPETVGPKLGIDGILKKVGIGSNRRPIIEAVIKPRQGLSEPLLRRVIERFLEAKKNSGWVDVIRDDQALFNPSYMPLLRRVKIVKKIIREYERETGEKVLYYVSMLAKSSALKENAKAAIEHGADGIILPRAIWQLDTIYDLRQLKDEIDENFVIEAHIYGEPLFTKNGRSTVSISVFMKMFRYLGADEAHIGGSGTRYLATTLEMKAAHHILTTKSINLKPTLPMISGGVDLVTILEVFSPKKGVIPIPENPIAIGIGKFFNSDRNIRFNSIRNLRYLLEKIMRCENPAEDIKEGKQPEGFIELTRGINWMEYF